MSGSLTLNTTFRSVRWEETEIAPIEGLAKLTRVRCEQVYEGDIAGTSTLAYLMVYRDGGGARFVGMERIVGTVNGREGSFALHHEGTFENGVATMSLTVVEGAGSGRLRAFRGRGRFASAHASQYDLTLHGTFDDDT